METKENRSFSLEELEKIGGSDKNFVVEMIGVFITTLSDGLGEIEAAFQKKNFQTMSAQAHKIASPCLHMGAMKLHALLKRIELEADDPAENRNLDTLVKNVRQVADALIRDLKTELERKK